MADLGQAASGAATGATLGSVIPGFGTVIGGAIGGLGGLLGGLFGGGTANQNTSKNVGAAGQNEQNYQSLVNGQLSGLQGAYGQQNYDQFNGQVGGINQNYLSILNNLSQTGGVPNQQQTSAANTFFQQAYAPQQEQLRQQYIQNQYQSQQDAARMGRPTNDPVLQAKLLTGQQNQQNMLNSQITSGAAQYAMQLPGQQAAYAGQAAGQVNQLANQASQNRMTLLGLGNQLQQQQQNFRLASAGGQTSQQLSGSPGAAIGGFFGGAGLGAQAYNNFNGAFGQLPQTQQPAQQQASPWLTSNVQTLPSSSYNGFGQA